MRALTEDDLFTIAGHILTQPKILAEKWVVKYTINLINSIFFNINQ